MRQDPAGIDLRFRFGCDLATLAATGDGLEVRLANAVIAGSGAETWTLPPMQAAGIDAFGIHWWQNEDDLCAAVVAPVTPATLREITRTLYAALLRGLGHRHFYRIWNFIPGINEPWGELDRYKVFCLGRAEALELAGDMPLPAASAVGTPGDRVAIIALAGTRPALPVENPLQVPAYRYPARYGPRSPSFARAMRIGDGELYVSGTASIRESESLHDGDVRAQVELACENIEVVVAAAQLASPSGDGAAPAGITRVYLREPRDWPLIQVVVNERLRTGDAHFNVIQAEICRPELLIEGETYIRTTHIPGTG